MIKVKDILKQEIKLLAGLGIKDIAYFSFILSLNLFLLLSINLRLSSLLFSYILVIECILWVLLKSLSIKAYSRKYYIRLIAFYFKNLKYDFKIFNTSSQDEKFYLVENLINISTKSYSEIELINKSFIELIKNIYLIDESSKLKFKVFSDSEANQDNEFHPRRNLIIQLKANENLEEITNELKCFCKRNEMKLLEIDKSKYLKDFKRFFGINTLIRERQDHLKTKYFIKSLGVKEITIKNFSLIDFIKKLQSQSEMNISLDFNRHQSLSKLIKFKKIILKNFNHGNKDNKDLLEEIEILEKHINDEEIALKIELNIKLLAKSFDELKASERKLSAKAEGIEFHSENYNHLNRFFDKEQTSTYINLTILKRFNPFIEDTIKMTNGVKIASKANDNSLIYFDIFNKNFSNNYSINFIGDSGSGKSLAAKLLMRRIALSKKTNSKFIIIDSSLRSWEKSVDNLTGNIENFQNLNLPNYQKVSFQDKQVTLYNFYSIEKDIPLSQKYIFQILSELEESVKKQDLNYFLIIDEAWKLLINKQSKSSSELLSKVARTGRSMNIGLWTISQKPQDINPDIHSNSSNSFIFQIKDKNDKDEITKLLSLGAKEKEILNSIEIKKRGYALMRNQHFSGLIKFIFDDKEFEFLNSEKII